MSYKISCLLFAKNNVGEILLIQRKKKPNRGYWSPPGGKLEMDIGESPFECAIREARTDHQLVWPYFDKSHQGFWGINANFSQEVPKIKIEAKPF